MGLYAACVAAPFIFGFRPGGCGPSGGGHGGVDEGLSSNAFETFGVV